LLHDHPAVVADGAVVWQWTGRDSDGWRLACFNDTDDSVVVRVTRGDVVERWDCATGEVVQVRAGESLELGPMELVCLRLTDGVRAADVPVTLNKEDRRSLPLDAGWTLRMDDGASRPIDVHRGWEEQGLGDYSGAATYELSLDLDAGVEAGNWELELPAVHTAAEAFLNGAPLGRRGWRPYRFPIPLGLLQPGLNELRIRVYSTAANKYYAGTPFQIVKEPSGLTAAPALVEIL
jgi:hypothetical protein